MAAMDHEQVSLDHVAVVVTLKSASRRDQEEGGELDSQESTEEIKSREVELGSESWTAFASVVTQQQCYGHCPCDSAPHSS